MAIIPYKTAEKLFPGITDKTKPFPPYFAVEAVEGVYKYTTEGMYDDDGTIQIIANGCMQHRDSMGAPRFLKGPLYHIDLADEGAIDTASGQPGFTVKYFLDLRGMDYVEVLPHKALQMFSDAQLSVAKLGMAMGHLRALTGLDDEARQTIPTFMDCMQAGLSAGLEGQARTQSDLHTYAMGLLPALLPAWAVTLLKDEKQGIVAEPLAVSPPRPTVFPHKRQSVGEQDIARPAVVDLFTRKPRG